MSKTLYKYLSVDEDKNGNIGSFKVLEDATIKFTYPFNFNDPFDCYPVLKHIPLRELRKINYSDYDTLLKDLGIKGVKGKCFFNRIEMEDRKLKKSIDSGAFLNDILDDVGVSCFSVSNSNILLWSHYASHHKGFACEFLTEQNYSTKYSTTRSDMYRDAAFNLHSFPVEYIKDKNRSIVLLPSILKEKDLQNIILAKSIDWEYEQEYRVFDWSRKFGIHSYNPKLLQSVIFGAKMSDEYKTKLTELVHQFNQKHQTQVQIKQAKLSDHRYEIDVFPLNL